MAAAGAGGLLSRPVERAAHADRQAGRSALAVMQTSNERLDGLNARAQDLRAQDGELGELGVPLQGRPYELRSGDEIVLRAPSSHPQLGAGSAGLSARPSSSPSSGREPQEHERVQESQAVDREAAGEHARSGDELVRARAERESARGELAHACVARGRAAAVLAVERYRAADLEQRHDWARAARRSSPPAISSASSAATARCRSRWSRSTGFSPNRLSAGSSSSATATSAWNADPTRSRKLDNHP